MKVELTKNELLKISRACNYKARNDKENMYNEDLTRYLKLAEKFRDLHFELENSEHIKFIKANEEVGK